MNIDKNLIGGSSILLILTLLDEKDMYGYQIIKEIDIDDEDNSFDKFLNEEESNLMNDENNWGWKSNAG